MRISEIATLLNVTPKDVMTEVEAQREALTAQGFKIAKKLTTASGIDDDAVRHLMVAVDLRRREEKKGDQEAEKARLREEEEKRRAEEAAKRATFEAVQRRAAEEARRKADEALARRAEATRAAIPAPPAGPPPIPFIPAAPATPRPAAPVASAIPPVPVAPSAPVPAPVAEIPDPSAAAVVPPPVAPVAVAPAPAPVAPPAPPTPSFSASAAAPPPIPTGVGPFSAGTPRRQEQGPPPPRREGGPPPRREGGPPPRRDGSGPPRRDGGGPSSGRDQDRGGRTDRPSRPSGPPRQASAEGLADFVNQGLQPVVQDDHKVRRRPEDRTKERRRPDDASKAPKKKPVGDTTRRPSFRPTQIFEGEVVATSSRRPTTARPEKGKRKGSPGGAPRGPVAPPRPKIVRLAGDFTVGQFAEKIGIEPSEVVKRLFLMGEMLTLNQILDADIAEVLAAEYEVEISIEREGDDYDIAEYIEYIDPEENLLPRPPVVTVMGHVDHGKTTLLDHIRKANVVDQEFGGITQHIGAYYVSTEKGDIVFLDTPGHEAFTAMRARGANATDLVVLVVAANDGVKPQTVEAINHAKAAGVPIIVAVNKIDVEGANPTRVRQELMRYELLDEKLGGDVIMVDVSAKRGDNMKELLEMVALQAEVLDLKANADRPAMGTIVESHIDSARGAIATVLVQAGTLRVGDVFVCGTEFGRVRAMRDDKGRVLDEAGPARPVELLGLNGSPSAGEKFVVLEDEADAREIAEKRSFRRKNRSIKSKPHVTLENLAEHVAAEGEVKALNLILKADVQGSVEAISASLMKIKSDKVLIRILHAAVGPIGEGDVQLADASDAIIIGFNVRPDPSSRDLAQREGVEIRLYNLIYDLLEEIEKAMIGMLEPVFEEVQQSRCKVLQIFRVSKIGNIAGCFVEEGTIGRDHRARVVRGGTVIWTGKVKSLRRVKDDVKEVQSGLECGILLENYNDVKEDDIIETFTMKELAPTLVSVSSVGAG